MSNNNLQISNLLLIDKSKGMSSFAVIRELRRRTGLRKFGHAGTLDPLASGLLLIGVEQGTKLLTTLIKLDKEYVAEVLIGESRLTGDLEGVVTAERAYVGDLDAGKVEKVLAGMIDTLTLPVSAYSAIKVDGQPLYKRARSAAKRGEVVEGLPLRAMRVDEAELLAFTTSENSTVNCKVAAGRLLLTVRFKVGSGTYIRSLAEELGRRLGYPATLANLRRTRVGKYSIEDAQTLDSF